MPKVVFIERDGGERTFEAPEGTRALDVALDNGVDMEGTCGGDMACGTCHVIVDDADYDRLPPSSDEEEDMLDLTPGVTETSRLACQIRLTAASDGLRLRLPAIKP